MKDKVRSLIAIRGEMRTSVMGKTEALSDETDGEDGESKRSARGEME